MPVRPEPQRVKTRSATGGRRRGGKRNAIETSRQDGTERTHRRIARDYNAPSSAPRDQTAPRVHRHSSIKTAAAAPYSRETDGALLKPLERSSSEGSGDCIGASPASVHVPSMQSDDRL